MRLDIVKCHGSGNDFVMIDARDVAMPDARGWGRIARALSDRSGPVGSDGLLLLTKATQGSAAFGMVMLNPDGSEAELCLNGLRCIARMGFEATGLETARVSLPVRDLSVARARPIGRGIHTISETAGPASLAIGEWPMRPSGGSGGGGGGDGSGGGDGARDEHVERVIPAWPSARAFTAVAMPNPHLIAFVERVDDQELTAIGQVAERAPDWLPNRANVSFVEQREGGETPILYVRTFERGAGLTKSCGSAMAAATYAAALTGRIDFDRETVVLNKGGMVRALATADALVTIEGNATYEWAGRIEVDPATGAAAAPVIARRFDEEIAAWEALIGGA